MLQAIERVLDQLTPLEGVADVLQQAIGKLLQDGGSPAKTAKDALNGVWFQHPVHPAMTDIPIGAWTCATLLDVASAGDERLEKAADTLIGVGCLGAIGAALTGLADWQDTYGKERRTGLAHATLNTAALSLFATSWSLRRAGQRGAGVAASMLGYGLSLLAAYLGGDLVFRLGTQVNRTAWLELPEEWTPVAAEADLQEGKLVKGEADGLAVLLVKQNGQVYAMTNVCPHAGGPLNEGTLEGRSVICPWHASQFDLADGSILHGPATVSPPLFDTQISEGKVEVRRRSAE
jgi:nitrite reductase/ring-hydroxylating ferredoxin subunit/uncharacterized membrane protein